MTIQTQVREPISCNNKIANIIKFFFWLSPLGFLINTKHAKKYFYIWKNIGKDECN